MPKLLRLAQRASQLGFRATAERATALMQRKLCHARTRCRDWLLPTFGNSTMPTEPLHRYCHSVPTIRPEDWPHRRAIAELYLAHRFDLLGSGWTQVRHGMDCRGVEGHRYDSGPSITADPAGEWLRGRINRANLATAQSIWQSIEGDYQPIDWHLDFKSGYRWRENQWHGSVPYAHRSGVDIKVPWELGRMQHLPQLALAAAGAGCDPTWADRVRREFRNQVLDFIACNPPRFGVNWRCAMDVGIRAANWLVAYDLFCAGGMQPDQTFDRVFAQSIAAHGAYLLENLEWQRLHRGNHYLADITGLLFIAAYLPCSDEVNAWLAFAVRELAGEIPRQFTPDGANFEASTSYHRLSAEMAIFGSALILALGNDKQAALAEYDHTYIRAQPFLRPAPTPLHRVPGGTKVSPLTDECWDRLARMGRFSQDVTKPNGAVHQVGDNDSGRFLKLWPTFVRRTVAVARQRYRNLRGPMEYSDTDYWDEDHLDHRGMVAAASALVGDPPSQRFHSATWPDGELVRQWAGWERCDAHGTLCGLVRENKQVTGRIDAPPPTINFVAASTQVYRIPLPPGVTRGLAAIAYADFGLYIWRNTRMYLAVRCGPVGQEGNGGHAHNDQLAVELQVDGEDWICDPGTYLYTAAPQIRNQYRSVSSHFAPQIVPAREPANLQISAFMLPETTRAQCLRFTPDSFCGIHVGFGVPVYREVEVCESELIVRDSAAAPLRLQPLGDVGRAWQSTPRCPPSPGYGIARAA